MRIRKVDNQIEKQIATGLIVNKHFIEGIESIYSPDLISMSYVRKLADWCFNYYTQYGKAPKQHIQDIYNSEKRKGLPEEQSEFIESFLADLSDEYERAEKFNVRYILDQAESYLKSQHLKTVNEDVANYLTKGNTKEAEKLIEAYKRVERPANKGINVFQDKDIVKEAFDQLERNILFQLPGDLGRFVRPFERDNFVSIEGPEKRGKSYWLMELALRAHRSLCNVAYFIVGDMSDLQVIRRIYMNITKNTRRFSGIIKMPVLDCYHNQNDTCEKRERKSNVGVFIKNDKGEKLISLKEAEEEGYALCIYCKKEEPKAYKGALWHKYIEVEPVKSWRHAFNQGKERQERARGKRFKLFTYPAGAINVMDIRTQLDYLEKSEGFISDVVCIPEGSLVLTKERGMIPIEQINKNDRLWDGLSWVSHDGIIYKGEKEIIEYAGIRATSNHLFWTKEDGWRSLESCKRLGLSIAQTECAGRNIWIGENYISDSANTRKKKEQKGEKAIRLLCPYTMYAMWKRKMGIIWKLAAGYCKRLSSVFTAKKIPFMVIQPSSSYADQMCKPKSFGLEGLWTKGNRVQISKYIRGLFMDKGKFGDTGKQKIGIRPHKQQWSLRTWKYKMVYSSTKLFAHKKTHDKSKDLSVSAGLSFCEIFGRNIKAIFQKNDDKRSRSKMEKKTIQKERVWDIRNAGQFHRFTVQGVLAHNCIDYADNLGTEPEASKEFRHSINATWKSMRALSQERNILLLTATQSAASSYKKKRINIDDFSEDKRKRGHTTMVLTLNQTEEEKEKGLLRIGKMMVRDEKDSRQTVKVLECREIGRVILGSYL